MTDKNYSDIGNSLLKVLPYGWQKVCLFGQIGKDNYEIFFHVRVDGVYIQCFDLDSKYGISRKELRLVFSKIYQMIKEDQFESKWSNFTFILCPDGKFSIDYDYTDISKNTLEYKDTWKAKYLVD